MMLLELAMSTPKPLFVEPSMVSPPRVMLLAPEMAMYFHRLAARELLQFQFG